MHSGQTWHDRTALFTTPRLAGSRSQSTPHVLLLSLMPSTRLCSSHPCLSHRRPITSNGQAFESCSSAAWHHSTHRHARAYEDQASRASLINLARLSHVGEICRALRLSKPYICIYAISTDLNRPLQSGSLHYRRILDLRVQAWTLPRTIISVPGSGYDCPKSTQALI